MRAWIISDLHYSPMDALVGAPFRIPDADICICAGDISENVSTSIAYLRRDIERHMPVILVLGNHDYYKSSIDLALERARRQVEGTRIHLLENESLELDDYLFIGATLWTDFSVSIGGDEHLSPDERRAKAFGLVPSQMADFSCIYRSGPRRIGENGMVTVQEILGRHRESRAYIDRELAKPDAGRTVVVTHHAPLTDSFDARFYGQVTNAAFASDLSDLIYRRRPSLWVHGHIHRARDYLSGDTRIICNPRGYGSEREINGFRANLIIDL
ncbi:phosphohydrolase [Rhizobium leguminosarum]|uniref:metallophosphoesterase n=1 Tax=Rhizobium TaxID=379 RepID=UPI0010312E69|nr:metallophosphoesterase [Rhizobium leguminosarum]NKK08902.1 phosphohydrolase [Rhizobium leguminosarum bv. viciae]TBF52837.1 phosphohydrolase [Rhizobium leguminosarum]TBF73931.1 phosphohydrolase [Rhizobium leguminosarum]TBG04817.1 phosphohydrolase [Rhizobium leguminosarum]TBG16966.1 phosphohydrolase [Rhizobium leguminosarum]